MIFRELPIAGAYVLEPERHDDARGYFARTFCADELTDHGLDASLAQISTSFNARRGTLRGMHYQRAPHEETKLVRCTRGAIYDVILDLRTDSESSGRWTAAELDVENGHLAYVPKGCAHGFLTLADDTEVEYLISTPHAPDAAAGVRWDDPAYAIEWPFEPIVMSDKDRSW